MGFDSTFNSFNISSSGLTAERLRMEVVAHNIANANVTRTPEGGPFNRKDVLFQTAMSQNGWPEGPSTNPLGMTGVDVVGVVEDQTEHPRVYNPGHPDCDAEGFVTMPNVQLPIEMVNLITATRAYEANLKAAQAFTDMSQQAISLLKG